MVWLKPVLWRNDGAIVDVESLQCLYQLFSELSTQSLNFVSHARQLELMCARAQLAAVQFHLINTVILFLAREGFRRGCLRPPSVCRAACFPARLLRDAFRQGRDSTAEAPATCHRDGMTA